MNVRSLTLATLALGFCGFSLHAKADVPVFTLTQTATPTNFSAGNGVGQAVHVDTTTNIDAFGFYLSQANGGNLNFFLIDESNPGVTILNDTVAAPTGSKKAWTYLTDLDVTLNAGDTYIFGVYGNDRMAIGLDPFSTSSVGMSLPSGPSSYYFTGTTQGAAIAGTLNAAGLSTADVGLQVIDPPPAAPEPSSLVLLGTGILATAGVMHSRIKL